MYELVKTFRFEAAHKLPHHDGKCQRLHGHSFVGRVVLRGKDLHFVGPKSGMLLDFGDVSRALSTLLSEQLDHYYLNESTGLESPTSELLAQHIFEHLTRSAALKPFLVAVEIDETCTSSCRYEPA